VWSDDFPFDSAGSSAGSALFDECMWKHARKVDECARFRADLHSVDMEHANTLKYIEPLNSERMAMGRRTKLTSLDSDAYSGDVN
jgi:hypothetical protein